MNQLDLYEKFWQPSLYCLNEAERNGITIDSAHCVRGAELANVDAERERGLLAQYAPEVDNWRSPKQLAEFLYEHKGFEIPPVCGTRKAIKRNFENKPVTDEMGITYLADNAQSASDRDGLLTLLRYRKAVKYAQYLLDLPTHRDKHGRIHCVLAPDTDTGRLSARNPALQQIPKSDPYGIRRAFVAAPGHVLLVADYSQLEIYVLAHFLIELFDDYSLAYALESGDVHSWVARECWREETSRLTDAELKESKYRSDVKSVIYGLNYGKTDAGLGVAIRDSSGVGIGTRAARELRERIYTALGGVTRYQDRVQQDAIRDGFVSTLLGRRRPLPEAKSSDEYRQRAALRKALNTPIQGSAADIVTGAMLACCTIPWHPFYNKALGDLNARFLLQIHDELIYEVLARHAEEALDLLVRGMVNPVLPGVKLRVPLRVDAHSRERWQE